MAKKDPAERRTSERKQVLETFHVFVVIPQLGLRKLAIKDVSPGGISFVGEPTDSFKDGDEMECYFYVNPSLRLPLKMKVAHVTKNDAEGPRVGCEFLDTKSKAYKAFTGFLSLLDDLAAFVL